MFAPNNAMQTLYMVMIMRRGRVYPEYTKSKVVILTAVSKESLFNNKTKYFRLRLILTQNVNLNVA